MSRGDSEGRENKGSSRGLEGLASEERVIDEDRFTQLLNGALSGNMGLATEFCEAFLLENLRQLAEFECDAVTEGAKKVIKQYEAAPVEALQRAYSNALVIRGRLYQQGVGGPQDFPEAAYLYDKAVELENPLAMFFRAVMHFDGIGQDPNIEEGIWLLDRGAALDNSLAIIKRAIFHENGIGGNKNRAEAIRLLKRGIELRSARAMVELALIHEESNNMPEAISFLDEAVKLDHPHALYHRARIYTYLSRKQGTSFPPEVIPLLDRAIRLGHPPAKVYRAKLHEDRRQPEDLLEAIRLYDEAIELDDESEAMVCRAKLHQENDHSGEPKNLPEAIRLLDRAIALKNSYAMTERAHMHDRGVGGPRDISEAVRLFRQAAKLGSEALRLGELTSDIEDYYRMHFFPYALLMTAWSQLRGVMVTEPVKEGYVRQRPRGYAFHFGYNVIAKIMGYFGGYVEEDLYGNGEAIYGRGKGEGHYRHFFAVQQRVTPWFFQGDCYLPLPAPIREEAQKLLALEDNFAAEALEFLLSHAESMGHQRCLFVIQERYRGVLKESPETAQLFNAMLVNPLLEKMEVLFKEHANILGDRNKAKKIEELKQLKNQIMEIAKKQDLREDQKERFNQLCEFLEKNEVRLSTAAAPLLLTTSAAAPSSASSAVIPMDSLSFTNG